MKNTKIDYSKAKKLKISHVELSLAAKLIKRYNETLKDPLKHQKQTVEISNDQQKFIEEFTSFSGLAKDLIRTVLEGTELDREKIDIVNAKKLEYDWNRFETEVKSKYDVKNKSMQSVVKEDNKVLDAYNYLKHEKEQKSINSVARINTAFISSPTFSLFAWPGNILVTGNVDSSAGTLVEGI